MLLIAAPHAHGFGGCLLPRMSSDGIASVMVEWLEARGSKRKMACRRWKRRRACAPSMGALLRVKVPS
ncbi:hypothetical protein ACLUZS_25825 [Pseudomonas aeruginosa]|uniref:hypothetical protein n=1 Tax=Pseudomonas aeruginosa TaxID=287 RepID=UPI002455CC11|nr:hypothetical protein [Pseudomonas aeruginosa]MDH4695443.1 hypothetical protein [Pseudomonas aeruginosa]